MYSALQICCFLSMFWKILVNFLPRKREHCICSHSECSTNRISNKKCRVHLSCFVYHGMNLYKRLGNKKELLPLLPLHGVTCGTCVATWCEATVEMNQHRPPSFSLHSNQVCLHYLLRQNHCVGWKLIWIRLVLYKGKLILMYKDHTIPVFCVCSGAQLSRPSA